MITREQRDEALQTYKMYYLQNANYSIRKCYEPEMEHQRNSAFLDLVFELIIEHGLNTREKKRELVHMRQALMYCIRKHVRLNYSSIGRIFERDHATVLHAIKNIRAAKKYKQVSFDMQVIFDAVTTHLQNTTAQHNADVQAEENS